MQDRPKQDTKICEVTVVPKIVGIDEMQSKAEKLVETIKTANSLAGELAEAVGNIKVIAKVD